VPGLDSAREDPREVNLAKLGKDRVGALHHVHYFPALIEDLSER